MLLQDIQFPKENICDIPELFYRTTGEYSQEEKTLRLKEAESCSFDTYFNAFPLEKWKKYTILDNLQICLTFKGKLKVVLKNSYVTENDIVQDIVVSEHVLEHDTMKEAILDYGTLDSLKGSCYFEITCMSTNVEITSCVYATNVTTQLREIKLSVVICTFKREAFINQNLEIIRKHITENHNSELYDHFNVIVSDNGQSLGESQVRNISIYPNRNLGGSGGFTRGMIETLRQDTEKNITHVIMMDDDVVFDVSIFYRLYRFLRLLKKEYEHSTVGGAMLKLNHRNIQHEKGAYREQQQVKVYGQNIDLCEKKNVLLNEKEEDVNYSGWWFSCVSADEVREDNLPLPLFIHGDDVEYGLRNKNKIIFLNGIGLWHSTENKESSVLAYYDNRNDLIINAVHGFGNSKSEKRRLLLCMLAKVIRYRYKDALLIAKATEDFCKGIDWIKELDGIALHQELGTLGYRNETDFSDFEIMHVETDQMTAKFYLTLMLNFCLPALKKAIAVDNTVSLNNFWLRKEVHMCDANTKKGYTLKKSYKELWKVWKAYRKTAKLLDKFYTEASSSYRERFKEIENIDFWKKYLEIQ